jgi:hypothetical protein
LAKNSLTVDSENQNNNIFMIRTPKPPVANTDGLIKCLPPARTVYQSVLKSMREKFKSSINFDTTGQFHLPGQHLWLAGRRAGALFFARHQDYFIMTRKFASTYRDLVPFRRIIVTQNLSSTYRDWQKTGHRDSDGT